MAVVRPCGAVPRQGDAVHGARRGPTVVETKASGGEPRAAPGSRTEGPPDDAGVDPATRNVVRQTVDRPERISSLGRARSDFRQPVDHGPSAGEDSRSPNATAGSPGRETTRALTPRLGSQARPLALPRASVCTESCCGDRTAGRHQAVDLGRWRHRRSLGERGLSASSMRSD